MVEYNWYSSGANTELTIGRDKDKYYTFYLSNIDTMTVFLFYLKEQLSEAVNIKFNGLGHIYVRKTYLKSFLEILDTLDININTEDEYKLFVKLTLQQATKYDRS